MFQLFWIHEGANIRAGGHVFRSETRGEDLNVSHLLAVIAMLLCTSSVQTGQTVGPPQPAFPVLAAPLICLR